ncbi:MAG TPA: tyrosine-type recombinase/integrase [Archangium sp.]
MSEDAIRTGYKAKPSNGLYVVLGEGASIAQANAFLSSVSQRGLSPKTVRAYAHDLVIFFRWFEPLKLELSAVEEGELLQFIAAQSSAGAKPRSINRRLSTVRLFVRFATGREPARRTASGHYRGPGRDRNLGIHTLRPKRRVALRVKVPQTIVEPLTREHVRHFLGTVKHYRDLAIVYLMLLCGLRSAEVVLMECQDVALDELRLKVRGKGGKERAVPMPELLRRILRRYLDLERPESAATDRLFVVLKGKHRGQPMTSEGLRSLFRYRRRALEVSNANAHRFRHTFGADMARAGVRLPILQRMMGHAQAETTLQYINLAMVDIAAEYRRASTVIHRRYGRRR